MSKPQPIFIYGINIKDDRGKLKNCQLCGAKFTMSVKEHQCKRCKRAVCDKCAPNKAQVQKADGVSKKAHRLCNFCKDESDSQKRFIEQYKISFNKDSFSQQWLQSFGTDITKAQNDFLNALEDAKLSKDIPNEQINFNYNQNKQACEQYNYSFYIFCQKIKFAFVSLCFTKDEKFFNLKNDKNSKLNNKHNQTKNIIQMLMIYLKQNQKYQQMILMDLLIIQLKSFQLLL